MSSEQHEVRSFAREVDPDALDGAITFQEACHAVQSLKMSDEDKHIVSNKAPGVLKPCDLPFREINPHGTFLQHFADVITDQPQFSLNPVEDILSKCDYDRLPGVLGGRACCPPEL